MPVVYDMQVSSVVGVASRLRIGQHGVPIPVTARDFTFLRSSRPSVRATQPLIRWISGFFPRGKAAGATNIHRVPRLRKSGAIPQLPLYAFMAWPGTYLPFKHLYFGADKSLARPGRKQATATKLLTFANHSKTNQKFVRPTTSPRLQ